ncbi:MAG: hypothetical protein DRO06_01645, partial [Thermoproteota archaeon]
RRLYVELFGGGNLVLTDEEGTVLHLARPLKVRDRELRRGLKYVPPKARSVSEIDDKSVREAILGGVGEYVWRVVIERLSLGPPYLDEACRAAGVDPRSRLDESMVGRLAEACLSLLGKFGEPNPVIYRDAEGKEVNFAAFPLESLRERLEEVPGRGSLQATIDSYLSPKLVEGGGEGPSPLEAEVERQRALLREYERREEELVRKAEFIFSRLGEIEELLSRIRRGDVPDGAEVAWRTGEVRVEVEGVPLELNMRLGASGSAGRLYERAKTLRRKRERIKAVIGELEERIRREVRRERRLVPRVKRAWYERFRWFRSSEGFLVVAGKDSSTNRELVRRYMEPRDLFFHVDMPGGAVVIVKAGGRTPGLATIEEAGVYAASYSRAWRAGFSSADVYWVWGDQVKRHAPPGTYIPRGSFYIEGRREYLRVGLELCIGVVRVGEGVSVISAPPSASAEMLAKVKIVPGETDKEVAVKHIIAVLERRLLGRGVACRIGEDDVRGLLPPGGVRIEDEG